jgi:hypothetical protein
MDLELNRGKSNLIIYNRKDKPEQIEEIKVIDKLKYLGMVINDKRRMFEEQKKIIVEKANRMANYTYSVIERSVNKIMIGKTYWKSMVLPSLLYGVGVIEMVKQDVDRLQVIENRVYRAMLGAPRYTPVCTLRGEVGASAMRARIIKTKMNYVIYIEKGENEMMKEIYNDMQRRGCT